MSHQITYSTSQYPKLSHGFIRGEILGLACWDFEIQHIAKHYVDRQLANEKKAPQLKWLRLSATNESTADKRGLRALFLILSKFPEAHGQLIYFYRRLIGERVRLIEYK